MIDLIIKYIKETFGPYLGNLGDPKEWTPEFMLALTVAISTCAYKLWNTWKKNQTRRVIQKSLKAQLFDDKTVKNFAICYVNPDCCSVDPCTEAEQRNTVAAREPLFGYIDRYLREDSSERHLLLLADSGMGKTSAVLNYYARNQRRPHNKQHNIFVIPLSKEGADRIIQGIGNQAETVVFLDAFDEDIKAIQNHRERLRELMEMCSSFKRVLITCRTQFFYKDDEIPIETGIVKFVPRKLGEEGVFKFWKIYLAPFTDAQVDKFLEKKYPSWKLRVPWNLMAFWNLTQRRKASAIIKSIPLLSIRPMILSYMPDFLKDERKDVKYTFELYEIIVEQWVKRESRWVNEELMRAFSYQLAVNLVYNRERRKGEWISHTELESLSKRWKIPLEKWQISGRSLLNRDAAGNYKFAHRSILEYLFVRAFIFLSKKQRKAIEFTDQMKLFLVELIRCHSKQDSNFFEFELKDLSKVDLSSQNLQRTILTGVDLSEANLTKTDLKLSKLNGTNFRGAKLIQSDLGMARLNNANFRSAQLMQSNLSESDLRGAILEGADISRANLSASMLESVNLKDAKLIGSNLERSNLRYTILVRADLSKANLHKVDLRWANLGMAKLSESNLSFSDLTDASCEYADLSGSILTNANLTRSKMNNAELVHTDLAEANLSDSQFRQANLSGAILSGADRSGADLQGANTTNAKFS
jgi:uncharacterized protein YjbI with pentapeptide repeats